MRTTARRRPIERASLARRCVALIAIAAVSLGCVADTFSYSAVAPVPIAAGAAPVEPNPAPIVAVAAPPRPSTTPVPAVPHPAPVPPVPIVPAANATATVPILYYHRVQTIPAAYPSWSTARKRRFTTYDVLPAAFAAQLDWLFLHGYTTILPRDLAAHWDQGTPLPERPVIITLRRRIARLGQERPAAAQGTRDGRRVLPDARRDQAREPDLEGGPPTGRSG